MATCDKQWTGSVEKIVLLEIHNGKGENKEDLPLFTVEKRRLENVINIQVQ